MKIIGIAGGSGSGKSSAAYLLAESDPERFEILNLDDYQKLRTDDGLPRLHGMINWDHPDIIRWDDLIADVKRLKAGQPVTLDSKDYRHNPDYDKHGKRIKRTIKPTPVLIVDGYLSLYNPELRALYDRSFYLDLDEATRQLRRNKDTHQPGYDAKVLKPMHDRFVEPTKSNADVVLDVSGMTVADIATRIKASLDDLTVV